MSMEARLVEFAEALRQNGLRVSASEVVDAARALGELGLSDREQTRAALGGTLVKRAGDRETFQRVFDLFFSGLAKTLESLDAQLARELEAQGLLSGDELAMVLATVNRLLPGLSPLAQAALMGDPAKLAQIFRAATLRLDFSRLESPVQAGFFSRRLFSAAGGEQAQADLRAIEAELRARGLPPNSVEVVSRQLGDVLRRVEEAARREVARNVSARIRKGSGALAERSFHTLSRAEVDRAAAAVRKLAEKLKTRLIRRQRSRRRGALHVRRTLRQNLTWGGVPMVPAFRQRRPERPEVIVLCDVSDSVRNASRIMLLFTYTLQSLFARVRSFVFVSELGEVTRYFDELDVDEAIDLATAGKAISLAANSNYGRVLATFARDHLGAVGRRTTVMIIGDGRNNYNSNGLWALKDLKRKCRRLLWICPESERSWGFGDSEMAAYARHCHQAVVVQSLSDLERLADLLAPV